MKIVVLDGYAANPGDLSWDDVKALAQCDIYDRTSPDEVLARAADAEIILTNKVVITAETIASTFKIHRSTGYRIQYHRHSSS